MGDQEPAKAGYRWQVPAVDEADKQKHRLKVLNSFTRCKEPFVSNNSRTVKWYSCGPTVYDVSHLGHARCYITFDIIRRILSDYFGFNVFYVMNITDIDDKIIKRARLNYLFDNFAKKQLLDLRAKPDILPQIVENFKASVQKFVASKANESDADKKEMFRKMTDSSLKAIKNLESKSITIDDAISELKDILAEELDVKLHHTVSELSIFKALTNEFEHEFHNDMLKLNVLPPSALTRVSEYIEEIGTYIKVIENNHYAYRSNGSIYFDTHKFDTNPIHHYAKLVREAYGHKNRLDEGEGELFETQGAKKSPNDFALWKKSKHGEPHWQTQDFEPGRPGWHIECSVMASKLLGENFDIHSGGCDLKFPHHDNEIAQAEAYYNSGKNWLNYFIHSGHLTISGCKMSKSLKNFVTIRQALQDYSQRQLRFAFLAHGWSETLDYSINTMNTATSYEKIFKEFFLNVSALIREDSITNSNKSKNMFFDMFKKWSEDDHQLNRQFMDVVNNVDIALCDNLDTRSTLNHLTSLIKAFNKNLNKSNAILQRDIALYIDRILCIFGANFSEFVLDRTYLSKPEPAATSSSSKQADDQKTLSYVNTLAQFRSQVRGVCKEGNAEDGFKKILSLCDSLRDETLPKLGVRLEDRELDGNPFVVKLVDPETLAKEKALADRLVEAKRIKDETARLQKLSLLQQREEKSKVPPNDMFKQQTNKYSKFDDLGIPTHDATGKELSKSALKKLGRLYGEQEARFRKYSEAGGN